MELRSESPIRFTDILLSQISGMGEFNRPNIYSGTYNRIERMIDYIKMVANIANTQHAKMNVDPNSGQIYQAKLNDITRFVMNEFSLFTKDNPLSQDEYQQLLQAVAGIAENCHENLHLVFASVGVEFPNKQVYNIVIHAQCGKNARLDTITKSVPSTVDAVYKGTTNPSFVGSYYVPQLLKPGNPLTFDQYIVAIFNNRAHSIYYKAHLEQLKSILVNDKYYPPPPELISCIDRLIDLGSKPFSITLNDYDLNEFNTLMYQFRDQAIQQNLLFTNTVKPPSPLPDFIRKGDGNYSYKQLVEYAATCALDPNRRHDAIMHLIYIKNWMIYTHQQNPFYPVPQELFAVIDKCLQKYSMQYSLSRDDVNEFVSEMRKYKKNCNAKNPGNPHIGKTKVHLQQSTLSGMFNIIKDNINTDEGKAFALKQLDYLKDALLNPSPELLNAINTIQEQVNRMQRLHDVSQQIKKVQQMLLQRETLTYAERLEYMSTIDGLLNQLKDVYNCDPSLLTIIRDKMSQVLTKNDHKNEISMFQEELKTFNNTNWQLLDATQLRAKFYQLKNMFMQLEQIHGITDTQLGAFYTFYSTVEQYCLQKTTFQFNTDLQQFLQKLSSNQFTKTDLQNILDKIIEIREFYKQQKIDITSLNQLENYLTGLVAYLNTNPTLQNPENTLRELFELSQLTAIDINTRNQHYLNYPIQLNEEYSISLLSLNNLLNKLEKQYKLTRWDTGDFSEVSTALVQLVENAEKMESQVFNNQSITNFGNLLGEYAQHDIIGNIIETILDGTQNDKVLKLLRFMKAALPPSEGVIFDNLINSLQNHTEISMQMLEQFANDMKWHPTLFQNMQYWHFPESTPQQILNYDTTVECVSAGGKRFVTAFNICLDRLFLIGLQNVGNMPVGTTSEVSEVYTSNTFEIDRNALVNPFGMLAHSDITPPRPIPSSWLSVTETGVRNVSTGQIIPRERLPYIIELVDTNKYPNTHIIRVGNLFHVQNPPFGPDCAITMYQPYVLTTQPAYQEIQTPGIIRHSQSADPEIFNKIEPLLLIIEKELNLTEPQKRVVEQFRNVCEKILLSEHIDKNGLLQAIDIFKQRMNNVSTGNDNKEAVLSLIDNIAHYVNTKAEKQTPSFNQSLNQDNTGPQLFQKHWS